jgi:hypothetical protein
LFGKTDPDGGLTGIDCKFSNRKLVNFAQVEGTLNRKHNGIQHDILPFGMSI